MAEKACLCWLSSKGATRPKTYPLDLINVVWNEWYWGSLELRHRGPSQADLPNQKVAVHFDHHSQVASNTPSTGLLGRGERMGCRALCAATQRSGYEALGLSKKQTSTWVIVDARWLHNRTCGERCARTVRWRWRRTSGDTAYGT